MRNIALREHDAHARRCSLVGAAVGAGAGVLLEVVVLAFDVASLGTLLSLVATPMTPTDLAILPAAFAAVGLAVGPALGGEPPAALDD